VGPLDRVARGAAAAGLFVGAAVAPFSLLVRIGVFGVVGLYLAVTALAGRCGGYSILGRSTCALDGSAGGDGTRIG